MFMTLPSSNFNSSQAIRENGPAPLATASSKRFEFAAPRSRAQLGSYNDLGRRKPLAARAIIEEEEEEE